MKVNREKLKALLDKYKLVLLVLAAGVLLLLWPGGTNSAANPAAAGEDAAMSAPEFDLEALERKLEEILSRIDGAGEVSVALTVRDGVEWVYAADSTYSQDGDSREERSETVVISTGSGTEEVVPVQQRYPAFQGAVVVCEGGANPEIRLLVTQAVSALTGLGTDRISVCKSK